MTSDWRVAGSYDQCNAAIHILDIVYIMANTETIGLALIILCQNKNDTKFVIA